MLNNMKTTYICIEGKVQGIGFRYFTLQKAIKYNINGTVENNLVRKSVEVYCQGNDDDINLFMDELRKGPALSRILNFNFEIIEIEPYKNFRII